MNVSKLLSTKTQILGFNGNRYKLVVLIIALSMLAPIFMILIQSFKWYFLVDSPILQYISFLILHGSIPYKDVFDFNLPGTFLLHMFAIRFFGQSDKAFRLFDLFNLLIILLSIYLLLRKRNSISLILAIILFSVIHLAGGEYTMGQRDFLMVPYLGLGAFMGYQAIITSRVRYLFLAGLFLGFCSTIKPTPVLFAIFISLLFLLHHKQGSRRKIKALISIIAGFLTCPALVLGWLVHQGGFASFFDIFLHFLPVHLSALKRSPFALANELLISPLGIIFIVILFSFAFYPQLYERLFLAGKPHRVTYSILLCGIIYGGIHYWFQGKAWPYHLYPLFFFSILFCSLLLGDLLEIENANIRRFTVAAVAVIVFYLMTFSLKTFFHHPNSLNEYSHGIEKNVQSIKQGEKDISSLVGPGDRVQVFDSGGEGLNILYRLKLFPPTRFVQEVNFTWGPPIHSSSYLENLWNEFISELKATPPKCIVVFNSSLIFKNGLCEAEMFPDICNFITQNYELIITRNDYVIYIRKN